MLPLSSWNVNRMQSTYLGNLESWLRVPHPYLYGAIPSWWKHGLRYARQRAYGRQLRQRGHLHQGRFGLGWSVIVGWRLEI
jgi:hypothetical protein